MSTEQRPKQMPNLRRIQLIGLAALALAGVVAASGLIGRAHTKQALAQWSQDQAVPTVTLAKMEHGAATQKLLLPGNVQPYAKAAIFARVSGYLKSWQTDIGANVKAGQVLGVIDSPDLDHQFDQAKADLATANANAQLATLTAKRWQALATTQAVAQQAVDEKNGDLAAKKATADAMQANLHRLESLETFKTLVAPFDGVVTARNTDVGALINVGASGVAGQELFEVADLHKVRIYVQVPQAFTGALRPGLQATFDTPQYPGEHFAATLTAASSSVNMNSRSMQIELQADNTDGRLAGGIYCEVNLQIPSDPNVVRVPATALVPVDSGAQVAVVGDDNKVTMKPVKLGRDFGDSVEVVAGLTANDRVIDSPLETLRTGDTVRLAAPPAAASNTSQASTGGPANAPAPKAN
ncbi:MAG: efflux transporter periplasmic adaptor subunit [Rhodospirillales bacterium]|nr:efflux transporter periplasmic adaptor subunit [Rhodospirillales bacterium]